MQTWISLIKKDIRYLKYPLLLWVAFLIAYYSIKTQQLYITQDNPGFITVFALMYYIKKALVVILVPLIVQTDPLVGSAGSWFTRPVSRRVLFFAKISSILLLFLVLPLFGEFLRLMFNGVDFKFSVIAVLEVLIVDLAYLLFFVLLAVLTANFTRYTLAATLPLLAMLLLSLSPQLKVSLLGFPSKTLLLSKMLVLNIFVILVAGFAILYQYLSRKTGRTVSLSIVGLVLVPVLCNSWQLDFSQETVPVLPAEHPAVRDIIFSTDSELKSHSSSGFGDNITKTYNSELSCYMVPANYKLHLNSVNNIRLKTEKKSDIPLKIRNIDYLHSSYTNIDSKLEPISHMLDGAFLLTPKISRDNHSYFNGYHFNPKMLEIPPEKETLLRSGPFTYSADIHFDLIDFSPVAELPLKMGASTQMCVGSIRILEVMPDDFLGYRVKVKIKLLELFLTSHIKKEHSAFKLGFVLYNRKKKEALLQSEILDRYFLGLYPLTLDTLDILFQVPEGVTEEWFRDARLVVFKTKKSARFSKSICNERVQISESNKLRKTLNNHAFKVKLKNLRLPANPTPSKVRSYIGKILKMNTSRINEKELRIDKLMEVGNRHIGILANMGDRFHYYSTRRAFVAIDRLAGPGDKALIISVLERYPELIQTVERFKWQKDAKDVLLQRLRQNSVDYPGDWLKAVVKFVEPSSYSDLEQALVHNPKLLVEVYRDLQKLPGIDLPQIVTKVWNRSRYRDIDTVYRILPVVLKYGNKNALAIAIRLLGSHLLSKKEQKELWETVLRYTDYNGKAKHMRGW